MIYDVDENSKSEQHLCLRTKNGCYDLVSVYETNILNFQPRKIVVLMKNSVCFFEYNNRKRKERKITSITDMKSSF